ncbi:hypothetical protein MAR_003745 [Mya arenaria]|uniref:C-type lectin domain-containing protein n=1 Tax=Mya arenaria TaxID=6604 RepID=A0ABY7GA34_MYAAR|nr:hypothetical protein MAR_003745 [Mya arenaria]
MIKHRQCLYGNCAEQTFEIQPCDTKNCQAEVSTTTTTTTTTTSHTPTTSKPKTTTHRWVSNQQAAITVTDWAPEQPSNTGPHHQAQDCIAVKAEHNYQWDDQECNHAHAYICEQV